MSPAVIFDLDGVIVDSESLQSRAFEQVLVNYGVTPHLNEQGIVHTVGITERANWAQLKQQYHLTVSVDQLVAERQPIYQTLLLDSVVPMPGVVSLIKTLFAQQHVLAVASSSIRSQINVVLQQLHLASYFTVIVSGEEVLLGKPNPAIYQLAAKRLVVKPADCVVIEDSAIGVAAAKAAGMAVLAAPNRFTQQQDFTLAGEVITSLAEPAIVERIVAAHSATRS